MNHDAGTTVTDDENIKRILYDMALRFTSGNGVPCERAYILKEDWEAIVRNLKK